MASDSSRSSTEMSLSTWLKPRRTRAAWWSFVTRYVEIRNDELAIYPHSRQSLSDHSQRRGMRRSTPGGVHGTTGVLALWAGDVDDGRRRGVSGVLQR